MNNNKKQLALITGATGVIGSAVVKKLSNDGYYIIGIGRDQRKSNNLLQNIGQENGSFHNIDLGRHSNIINFFRNNAFGYQNLSLVVMCAGILKMDKTVQFNHTDWQKIIDINVSSTFFIIQESLKIMQKNNQGLIIVIGSRWGSSGAVNAAAYSASKAALKAMIKSIQLEYINTHIRSILVSPGSVESEMSDLVNPNIREKLLKPEDIANLISYIVKTPENVVFDEIIIKSFPYDLIS